MNTPSRASYNITNDRLKVWFAERLPADQYAEAKRLGFVYWFGSKCLTRVWTPEAEDFITSRGIEIEEDDAPDDSEARVERFGQYANNAEQSAESRENYLNTRANTERRQRLALAGAARETEKAAYWQGRIERSIAHASFKESPGLIARRIEGLTTDARKWENAMHYEDKPGNRNGSKVWIGNGGRSHGFWIEEARLPVYLARCKRWADHIEDRLTYERAILAAAGGLQAGMAAPGGVEIEVGGAVFCEGKWLEVTKVNPKSVEVYNPSCHWQKWRKMDRTRLSDIATKLRVDAGEIDLGGRAPVIEKPKAGKTTTSRGDTPEKLGAFGQSSTFTDDLSKPVLKWYLIVKVNAKTVEYLDTRVEQIQDASGAVTPKKRYALRKDEIYGLGRCISAAQVAAEHPDLLADWAKVQEIQARRAETQKAQLGAA